MDSDGFIARYTSTASCTIFLFTMVQATTSVLLNRICCMRIARVLARSSLPALQIRLAQTKDWLILTPPIKSSSNRGFLLQRVGTRFCISWGNATRVRGWWKSGCDQCVSNSTKTEVWIAKSTVELWADVQARLAQLAECLGFTGKKETWGIGSSLGEKLYLQGSEAGLLGA